MCRSRTILLLAVLGFVWVLSFNVDAADEFDFFEKKIRPVLVERCYECHSVEADKAEGGLLLDSREAMRKGGESGPAVTPNKPAASLILSALRYESLEMPPDAKLGKAVVADFENWIRQGAPDPRAGSGSAASLAKPEEIDFAKARSFWAFQPPLDQAVPPVQQTDWPRSKLDSFVLSEMEKEGLSPAGQADRRTLVRRLYFDLIGLPPEPGEVVAFLKDESPSAYESMVDRLLNSPGFGEKWARLWLDVSRYAEDQAHIVGNNKSLFFPNAFLYRDWLIESLNDDLPYDEFVRRQLAVDLMKGVDGPERAALGFIGLGPKYYRRNDPEVMADEWEDRVDTVSRGLLGMTVACARCHDHKYDPIATEDYYALAGVFASTDMFNAPLAGAADEPIAVEEKPKDKKTNDKPAMHVVREGKIRNINVQIRGNAKTLGEEVPRGFLQVLSDEERQSFSQGSGRLELADAIVNRNNPLTARVIVNRIWGQLFGRHLVTTPSNFGSLGERPSHPELLDDLAVRFMDKGWSLKRLIREIVLSSTYQQSSIASPASLERDPDNVYLSRMNRRRLSIEGWRDNVLAVAGRLSTEVGGESINIDDPSQTRRTIYSKVSRFELNPMLSLFDFPDPNVHSAKRVETTTALQRLFHLNSKFMVANVESLARQIEQHNGDLESRIEATYLRLFARKPDADELLWAAEFLSTDDKEAGQRRLRQYAQLLLISNEMIYLD